MMSMLGAAVNGLTNLETLVPVVRQLGARHVNYGVGDAHYATVGEARLCDRGPIGKRGCKYSIVG